MNEHAPAPSYKRHRFPPEIIGHAVWLYFRFALSDRDVGELLAERGVILTYESIRQWCQKFGQQYANTLRRRRPQPGDKWHLDEVFIRIGGVQHYRWRAVDQDGNVLDILVQARRDKRAATKFLRKLLKGLTYVPRVVITDKLASYGAAMREVLPSVEHRRHKGLNNRAENSHQPTPSGSSPPTARSPRTAARAVTASPPTITAIPETSASPPGGRSPAPRRWPDARRSPPSARLHSPTSPPTRLYLTIPHVLLQREGWHVNHKRVYRRYRLEGLSLRLKSCKKRVRGLRGPKPVATRPNEC